MINRIKSILLTLSLCFTLVIIAQDDSKETIDNETLFLTNGYVAVNGIISQDGISPFWMYTNTNNTIARESTYSTRAGLSKAFKVGEKGIMEFGGGLNLRDGVTNHLQIEELYGSYTQKWFNIIAGVKHREKPYDGLSTINGDILWTGNARSIPGVEIKTALPVKLTSWLDFKASLAHYELNDDRNVDGARIHHKSLDLIFKIKSNQTLSAGLSHYVQWGGTSPTFGKQPSGLKDFIKLFFGQSGGSTFNDQVNALGNHIGSYKLNYHIANTDKDIDIYYQSLFEDRSGRELNNFPDGVWGVAVQLKEDKLFDTFLVEYIQTVSQSGRPTATEGGNQQSGGDGYFGNSVYRSGWTYQGNIIGLPFIIRNSLNSFTVTNRTSGFQLGASGSYKNFDYQMKSTFVTNLGTYQVPFDPKERAIYTYGNVAYKSKFGVFNVQLGADISNVFDNTFGAGIGYQYNLN